VASNTVSSSLEVGIACDLRTDFESPVDGPDDFLEEYDSEETVRAIALALEHAGHRVRVLGGGRRLVRSMLENPPDLVFNICEGWGECREAHAASMFELLGVPYTHSGPLTLAMALNKQIAKQLVAAAGIRTPRASVCGGGDVEVDRLAFPLIAKPLSEGSSIGVRADAVVDDERALVEVVARLRRDYRQPVLIEEFCPGPEVTVGIVGMGDGARAVGAMEIEPASGDDRRFVYLLETKREFSSHVHYHVPPRVSLVEAERAALASYHALSCRDVGRVDLRLDVEGRVNFIELNPLPGLCPGYGDLVILAERSGVSYEDLIATIVDEARRRLRI
jgi:D-alanine-D-alanine ligase